WFGLSFGASIVMGFALTLAIGVAVSMFSAIMVTRTFMHLVQGFGWAQKPGFYGTDALIPADRTLSATVGRVTLGSRGLGR
ncbi:MAG TPA: hypothetical protein VMZ90_06285, partial [Vicinamibacterales bacterium]|nr:hypothetical protein [Vicinamibacterales bacterium]